jgi:hypothetical protein
MAIKLSYPGKQEKEDYIQNVASEYFKQYEELSKSLLELFIGEIVSKVESVIDSVITDGEKIEKIDSLKKLASEIQKDINSLECASECASENHVLDSEDENDRSPVITTTLEELELYVSKNLEIIEVDITNGGMQIPLDQDMERLQNFIGAMAKKCINEICDATLASQCQKQASPNNSPRTTARYEEYNNPSQYTPQL